MLKRSDPQRPVLKTAAEIAAMRRAGQVVAEALRLARSMVQPGVTARQIDQAVEDLFRRRGALPLFKGYPGKVPFPAVTCISFNEQVVHGIPSDRPIRSGDLVKIDTACRLDGWCADAAICVPVGEVSPDIVRLVRVAEEALAIAIREIGRKAFWSEVAALMEQHVHAQGFSMVEKYVGHGIGRAMHEPPQVPNFTSRDMRRHDCRLQPGLVLAIEPMVNMGRKDVVELPDKWTVITRDRLPSAHVEHTVALTEQGPLVLTAD
ncbi:MAG: type I methionyl aminopeptidase [Gemmataceae bacterium]